MDNSTSRIPKDPTLSPDEVKRLMDRIRQISRDSKISLITRRYNTVYRDLTHTDDLPIFLHRPAGIAPSGSTCLVITRTKVRVESDGLYTFKAFDAMNLIRDPIDSKSDEEP